jgi:hypothetical protein
MCEREIERREEKIEHFVIISFSERAKKKRLLHGKQAIQQNRTKSKCLVKSESLIFCIFFVGDDVLRRIKK